MVKKRKKIEINDNLELEALIQESAKINNYTRPGAFLDTLTTKYLMEGDKITILTNLIEDARKRISELEGQVEKGKAQGEKALEQADALKNPDNLPAPTE